MSNSEKVAATNMALRRRKTDVLPDVILRDDKRYYIRSSDLARLHLQAGNLAKLMESAKSIMAEKDLDSLLSLIMDHVTGVLQAERSSLFLIDTKTNELWSRVVQGTSEIRIPMGEGIAGHVVKTGQIVNIPDAYNNPHFNSEYDKKTGYKTKSILGMPIKNPNGEIMGTIEVLNKTNNSSFTKEDEGLLEAFSSLAGISLASALTYDQLAKERDLLEARVKERTKDLEASRKKSDELLLNILPSQIAEELKSQGFAVPRRYDLVSVLFTDIQDFRRVVEEMEPEALIDELDKYFFYFDEVLERYNLEKIKTIGDSYMCAGGIPQSNNSNPIEAVLAAIDIQKFTEKMRLEKISRGEPYWELRLGINSGPVIAGVVGKKKFAYDIWGETVNTASRMESSGKVRKINISATTYELVKNYFNCTSRGKVAAKDMGEIDMYFVDGLKDEFHENQEGKEPGEKLRKIIQNMRNS